MFAPFRPSRFAIAHPLWLALLLALTVALSGCGNDKPKPIELPKDPPPTAAPSAADEDDDDDDDDDDKNAVEAPGGVTIGDVLKPLPKPAPKLYDGSTTASAMPEISCEDMAPEKGFNLARKIDVVSGGASKKDGDQTLELCLFNKWEKRTEAEVSQRTGRKHHFAAAFPGTSVASWTSKEVTRGQLGLHEGGGTGLAAGWATIVATGVPQWPAVAVVSARFYGGPLGEEVHYLRRGRVLLESRGRWVWSPLTERIFKTLDVDHLKSQCEGEAGKDKEACEGFAARIKEEQARIKARAAVRKARLAGKTDKLTKAQRKKRKKPEKLADPRTYRDDPDPHAGWIRDGRKALKSADTKLAIRNGLRVLVACGEASKEAIELIGDALKKQKVKPVKIQPIGKRPPLCEPLFDKPAPTERKK